MNGKLGLVLIVCSLAIGAWTSAAQEIKRECSYGDCLSLAIRDGTVVAERTGAFSTGTLQIGKHDARGARLLPSSEVPVFYGKTQRGWVAVVAAYIPRDFLLWPELRLHIFDSEGQQRTVEDLYNSVGKPDHPNIRIGKIFNSNTELLQVSTDGEHAYVVRTLVWHLPTKNGSPVKLLDVLGLVDRVQQPTSRARGGFWIQRQTYDGLHARTKGWKLEFWAWDEGTQKLILTSGRR